MSGPREPELRILELLSHDAPLHWSRVAVRARLRPSSVQQYLSRLVRRGLVRRVSVGHYVLAEVVSRPAWEAVGTRAAQVAAAVGAVASVLWDSSMLTPLLGRDLRFTHLTVLPEDLSVTVQRLERGGLAPSTAHAALVPESVLVRSAREPSCVLRGGIARPERAAVDLLLERRHGVLPLEGEDVVRVLAQMYRWRMISLSRLLRYAARRGVQEPTASVLEQALPEIDRRTFRARLRA